MEKLKPINTKICRFLRAKNPYGSLEGGEAGWLLLDEANTHIWCIKSMGPVGPDNGLADPHRCVGGRACFVKPS